MDDGKADQPPPIIPPPHSRNDTNTAPTDYIHISISTAVLPLQIKVIDNYGDIPIIVGFHNKCLLENL